MLDVEDRGTGNWLEVGPAERAALAGRIVFTGAGARVAIGPGCVAANLQIEAGAGAIVSIGADCHLGHLFVLASAGASIRVGPGCGFNGAVRLLAHEPASLSLGAGCLVASEVDVTVSDMHAILDAATGQRVNAAADVAIADRVWLGQRSMVLKGAAIGADTVIGAGSVVTGAIPAGCTAAGNPARVLRRGVRWRMEL